jgi:hypothetical protein
LLDGWIWCRRLMQFTDQKMPGLVLLEGGVCPNCSSGV